MNIHSFGSVMKKRVAVPLPAFIILCLFAVIVPVYVLLCGLLVFGRTGSESAQKVTTETIMVDVLSASQDYYANCRRWPSLGDNFRALFLNDGTTNWNGPYLPRNMRNDEETDAWGSHYVSRIVGERFYLISPGSDTKIDTCDDLKVWATPCSKVNIEDERSSEHGGK